MKKISLQYIPIDPGEKDFMGLTQYIGDLIVSMNKGGVIIRDLQDPTMDLGHVEGWRACRGIGLSDSEYRKLIKDVYRTCMFGGCIYKIEPL